MRAMLAVFLRAGLGAGGLAILAIAGSLPFWGIALCLAGAAMFALYGVRAAIRHGSPVAIDEHGIERRGPFPRRLDWRDLTSVKIAHYSTRRDGRNGWQELVMRTGTATLVLESEHPVFERAAMCALASATQNGAQLSAATLHNANELGLWPDMSHDAAMNGASR